VSPPVKIATWVALTILVGLTACGPSDVDPQKAEFGAFGRPSSLPGFVKVYPGGHVTMVMEEHGGDTVLYDAAATPDQLQAFYRDEAGKGGLEHEVLEAAPRLSAHSTLADYTHGGASKPKLHVSIWSFADRSVVTVSYDQS
jgi:hypothetical protein